MHKSNLPLAACLVPLQSDDQSSRRPDHWAAAAFVPQLGHLERSAFNELLTLLWESILMPAVVGSSKASAGVKAATTKRATQEAAIKKWFEGLDNVSHWLETTGSAGHSQLLCVQVLLQLLRKLDAMMFYHLLLKGGIDAPQVCCILSTGLQCPCCPGLDDTLLRKEAIVSYGWCLLAWRV